MRILPSHERSSSRAKLRTRALLHSTSPDGLETLAAREPIRRRKLSGQTIAPRIEYHLQVPAGHTLFKGVFGLTHLAVPDLCYRAAHTRGPVMLKRRNQPWLNRRRSLSTIMRTSSAKPTVGVHPSRFFAFPGSPIKRSTSAGRT